MKRHHVVLRFLCYIAVVGWYDAILYCVFLFSVLNSYGLKWHHVVFVFYFIFQLCVEVTPCCIMFSILLFSYVLKWHHVVFVFYFIFQLCVEVTPCCIVFSFILYLWVEVTPCCICFLFYISAMGWSETMLYSVFVGHLMSTVTKVSFKFNSSCLFGDFFKWIKRAKR